MSEEIIQKYGIYLYLVSLKGDGYEPYLKHIVEEGFIPPEKFFKRQKKKWQDPVENFHSGRNAAAIATVLPFKDGYTRPDAPYTIIYGYKGFRNRVKEFGELRQVACPRDDMVHIGTPDTYFLQAVPDMLKLSLSLQESVQKTETIRISRGRYMNGPAENDNFNYLKKLKKISKIKITDRLTDAGKSPKKGAPLHVGNIRVVLIDKKGEYVYRLAEFKTEEGEVDYVQSSCGMDEDGSNKTIYMTKQLFKDLSARALAESVFLPHIEQFKEMEARRGKTKVNVSSPQTPLFRHRDAFQGHFVRKTRRELVETIETTIHGIRFEGRYTRVLAKIFKSQARDLRSYIDLLRFVMEQKGLSREEIEHYLKIGAFYVNVELVMWPLKWVLWVLIPMVTSAGYIPMSMSATLFVMSVLVGPMIRFLSIPYFWTSFFTENRRSLPLLVTFLSAPLPHGIGLIGLPAQIFCRMGVRNAIAGFAYFRTIRKIAVRLYDIVNLSDLPEATKKELVRYRFHLADSIYKFQREGKLKIITTYYNRDKLADQVSDYFREAMKHMGVLIIDKDANIRRLKRYLNKRYEDEREPLKMFYELDIEKFLKSGGESCEFIPLFAEDGSAKENSSRQISKYYENVQVTKVEEDRLLHITAKVRGTGATEKFTLKVIPRAPPTPDTRGKIAEVAKEEHQSLIKKILNLFPKSIPLYVFKDTEKDLFGLASPNERLIALHENLAGDLMALFHEIGHFLIDMGGGKKGLLDLQLVKRGQKTSIRVKMRGSFKENFTEIGGIELSSETLKFIEDEEWQNWQRDSHYLLRVLQREVFGVRDKVLTRKIEKQQKLVKRPLSNIPADEIKNIFVLSDYTKPLGAKIGEAVIDLWPLVTTLHKKFPDATIYVATHFPDIFFARQFNGKVKPIPRSTEDIKDWNYNARKWENYILGKRNRIYDADQFKKWKRFLADRKVDMVFDVTAAPAHFRSMSKEDFSDSRLPHVFMMHSPAYLTSATMPGLWTKPMVPIYQDREGNKYQIAGFEDTMNEVAPERKLGRSGAWLLAMKMYATLGLDVNKENLGAIKLGAEEAESALGLVEEWYYCTNPDIPADSFDPTKKIIVVNLEAETLSGLLKEEDWNGLIGALMRNVKGAHFVFTRRTEMITDLCRTDEIARALKVNGSDVILPQGDIFPFINDILGVSSGLVTLDTGLSHVGSGVHGVPTAVITERGLLHWLPPGDNVFPIMPDVQTIINTQYLLQRDSNTSYKTRSKLRKQLLEPVIDGIIDYSKKINSMPERPAARAAKAAAAVMRGRAGREKAQEEVSQTKPRLQIPIEDLKKEGVLNILKTFVFFVERGIKTTRFGDVELCIRGVDGREVPITDAELTDEIISQINSPEAEIIVKGPPVSDVWLAALFQEIKTVIENREALEIDSVTKLAERFVAFTRILDRQRPGKQGLSQKEKERTLSEFYQKIYSSERDSVDFPPFVPTSVDLLWEIWQAADIGGRKSILDLGSGDGRAVLTAAVKGLKKCVGVELREDLVVESKICQDLLLRLGVDEVRNARFVHGDFTDRSIVDFSEFEVFHQWEYISEEARERLSRRLQEEAKPGTLFIYRGAWGIKGIVTAIQKDVVRFCEKTHDSFKELPMLLDAATGLTPETHPIDGVDLWKNAKVAEMMNDLEKNGLKNFRKVEDEKVHSRVREGSAYAGCYEHNATGLEIIKKPNTRIIEELQEFFMSKGRWCCPTFMLEGHQGYVFELNLTSLGYRSLQEKTGGIIGKLTEELKLSIRQAASKSLRRGSGIFTHGHLHYGNILIKEDAAGNLTDVKIIDWTLLGKAYMTQEFKDFLNGERKDLENVLLDMGTLEGFDFEGVNLRRANFAEGEFPLCIFKSAILEHAVLKNGNFWGGDFRGADLKGADLSGYDTDLSDADFRGADLRGAILQDAYLEGADLRGAQFEYRNIIGAIMDNTLFSADKGKYFEEKGFHVVYKEDGEGKYCVVSNIIANKPSLIMSEDAGEKEKAQNMLKLFVSSVASGVKAARIKDVHITEITGDIAAQIDGQKEKILARAPTGSDILEEALFEQMEIIIEDLDALNEEDIQRFADRFVTFLKILNETGEQKKLTSEEKEQILTAFYAKQYWSYTWSSDEPFAPAGMDVLSNIFAKANLENRQSFLDLGSGDGRAVLAAAVKGVKKSVGVERRKNLIIESRVCQNLLAHLGIEEAKDVKFIQGDFTDPKIDPDGSDFSKFDTFYHFQSLSPETEEKLVRRLREETREGALFIYKGFSSIEGFGNIYQYEEGECPDVEFASRAEKYDPDMRLFREGGARFYERKADEKVPADGPLARDFLYTLMMQIMKIRNTNENIIIGIDTSWIPREQKAIIELTNYLSGLRRLSQKKGFGNIIITHAEGDRLADAIYGERKRAQAKKGIEIPASNVIVIGKQEVVEGKAFEKLKEEGAFFTKVKVPEAFPDYADIMLLEILSGSVNRAFGKGNQRDWIFDKLKAVSLGLDKLQEKFETELKSINTAA
ncbi:MAG: pentapeptide repeat-containing protein [Candidatus Omnitrophota bacterium]